MSPDADPYDLARLLEAQDSNGTYDRALVELEQGSKVTHWMWFVFPQIAGLGRSATARHFAIISADEAWAYADHPVLGPRLRRCSQVVADTTDRSAEMIFGAVDAMKLHSSMTLFAHVAPDETTYANVLATHFDGEPDQRTLRLLV